MTSRPILPTRERRSTFRWIFALFLVGIAAAFFLYPCEVLLRGIFDPALNGPGVPQLARDLHLQLTPRYAKWATQRKESGKAAGLSLGDVSGTEWPLFGSVFYLRAEEAIQAAWEHDPTLFAQEPRLYAREAIEAAARLVADPEQAIWVRRYWGDAYLERENVFYRMLLISALASHRRLTGSDEFMALLRSQTDSMAAELAASPYGVLDDYPGQCYPGDVAATWEAIQRADHVLGTDHSTLIAEARRGFTGARVREETGLPAYGADSKTGQPFDASRGCSNSSICELTSFVWPDLVADWYRRYERLFWQHDWLAAGFREYRKGTPNSEYTFDIDAGPVVRGNGFSACAFGIAAARSQGRFDHAYLLSVEAIALSWPLPGGRLLIPDRASDSQNAPLLGEACVFFQLAHRTAPLAVKSYQGTLPAIVFICFGLYLLGAALCLWLAWRIFQGGRRARAQNKPRAFTAFGTSH